MDDQGDRVFFNGTGTDSDGTIVRYRWTSSINGLLSTQSSFNTTSLSPGNHTIEFVVQDNSTLWSVKSDRWLYINDQPVATIDSVSTKLVYSFFMVKFWEGVQSFRPKLCFYSPKTLSYV